MFRQHLFIRDHELTHVFEQVNREQILEIVAEVRREQALVDREGLGRWALCVPLEDWARLRRDYPDLNAKDGQIRSKAWMKFIQSDESYPYRMRERI